MTAGNLSFSVVVPTYNRRDVLLGSLLTIARLERPWPTELIVAVDGSTDGTTETLTELTFPFPLRVFSQANRGAAAARNLGARNATGEYLLFLDDDMAVDRMLLVQHALLLARGADAVVGHLPVHPESPDTLLTRGVGRWAQRRLARLGSSGGTLQLADLLTGQLSVRAVLFAQLGGFDETLTAGGTFGGEDTDFLYRLLASGAMARFNPAAVSYQKYLTTARSNLLQWEQAGWTDAALSRKHRGIGAGLYRQHGGSTRRVQLTRVADRLAPRTCRVVRERIADSVDAGASGRLAEFAFATARDQAYWAGAAANAGLIRNADPGVRILAYHAVDRLGDPGRGCPTVSPEVFGEHIEAMLSAGYAFLDAKTLLAHLDGQPVPDRSVVLTFDDGYRSVADHAAPVLAEHRIPALVAPVTGLLGRHNGWDCPGAPRRELMDLAALRALADAGWTVASHTASHQHLRQLGPVRLAAELAGSRQTMATAGLGEPDLLVFPFGEHDLRVRRAARQAGYRGALAMTGPCAWPTNRHRYALARIEVCSGTSATRLLELLGSDQVGRRRWIWEAKGTLRMAVFTSTTGGQPAS